jgi:hypothetical protein
MNPRIFSGIFPTGISYADRQREKAGDYARLAFLDFAKLQLTIEPDAPADLAAEIRADAAAIQAQRGTLYQVSTSGQTIRLGFATI